ncbi:MAG: hypothetical protein KKD63_04795 [Proteobacteria bacterium]|nr:hypothetical protein [Desulfobulbaceae bacterium]MBU4152179.1 hypothetical protein [Pseudomonadota bacterium]
MGILVGVFRRWLLRCTRGFGCYWSGNPVVLLGVFIFTVAFYTLCHGAAQQATATTSYEVDTQIAVQALTPTVFLTATGGGEISGTVEFGVEANVSTVRLFLENTPLYYERDDNGEVPPIPLNRGAGVIIETQDAVPRSHIANYEKDGELVSDLPSLQTETVTFTSQQGYIFSQRLQVTISWTQNEQILPAGTYTGKMRLTCLVEPPNM